MDDTLERLRFLKSRGLACAVATVVRAERPTSARPGMKAIVLTDGTLEGWVGGSCAHPIVTREALQSIREGTPRLISLSPRAEEPAREGVVHHTITCHSGGGLEIYIEPVLPAPHLLLIGEAPLVQSLATMGKLQGFKVSVVALGDAGGDFGADTVLPLAGLRETITPQSYVVVATMGTFDEEALAEVVGTDAAYVALVASRRRADAIFAYLTRLRHTAGSLGRVKVPAGIDIAAVTPEEIAVSIMAEIIQVRRRRPAETVDAPPPAESIDPICGMSVETATARYKSLVEGVTFYFCSAGCKDTFDRDPTKYTAVHA